MLHKKSRQRSSTFVINIFNVTWFIEKSSTLYINVYKINQCIYLVYLALKRARKCGLIVIIVIEITLNTICCLIFIKLNCIQTKCNASIEA